MKENFSEGPWEVYENSAYLEISCEKGQIGDVCASGHVFDGGKCKTGIETVANANLIASAPEMYNMLKKMTEAKCLEKDVDWDHVSELLAKARGEL